MIKNNLDALNVLNQIGGEDQNSSYVISLSNKNLHLFVQKQKQIRNINVEEKAYIKTIYDKTGFTHIFSLSLIKQHRKSTFSLDKQLHISKVTLKTLIPMIVLAPLLYITRLIRLNKNRNQQNV